MKKEKESLGFKIFWFMLSFVPKYCLICLTLLFADLTAELSLISSLFIALFWAKNEIDRTDLENKIFELKKLIENANTKT